MTTSVDPTSSSKPCGFPVRATPARRTPSWASWPRASQRVHAAGARLGASVFGIAATRPDEIAQDIPRMATVVDYVAPMVYPSHWGPGEYGVAGSELGPL